MSDEVNISLLRSLVDLFLHGFYKHLAPNGAKRQRSPHVMRQCANIFGDKRMKYSLAGQETEAWQLQRA